MTKDITRKENERKEIIKDMNYTYIVKCSDGSLYTGWTNNLEKRIKDHNAGGARNTQKRAVRLCLFIRKNFRQSRKR